MKVEIVPSPDALAGRAAEILADRIRASVAARGRCLLAVSGGTEPWAAFRELAKVDLPWERVHLWQVDERAAPAGHPDRNWTHVEETLVRQVPIPSTQLHPMPVEDEALESAAARYAASLAQAAGNPPCLDLVHLGLGADGHTASLVPGDAVLEATADVAVTAPYQGWRRMTLTLPALDRAREIFWLVAGAHKTQAYRRLVAGDTAIPAARVRRNRAFVLTDRRTAGEDPSATGR